MPVHAQEQAFQEADRDSDGVVTAAELREYVSAKLNGFTQFDALMKELDTDNNGSISAAEFAKRMDAVRSVQNRPETAPRKRQVVEFADQYDKRFAGRKPSVGETIPELTAYDERGNELVLGPTRAKYRVIVFGCLT